MQFCFVRYNNDEEIDSSLRWFCNKYFFWPREDIYIYIFLSTRRFLPIAMLTRIAPSVFTPMEYTLRAGAISKSVPAVREHTKSRLKSHFILSKSVGFPSPGGAIRSIDRSGPPITRGHEMGKHLSTSVSHPHFEMACTLTYVRNV